jgi:hypothetical protein
MIQRFFVRESLTQVKRRVGSLIIVRWAQIAKPVTTKGTKVHEGEPSIQKLRDVTPW